MASEALRMNMGRSCPASDDPRLQSRPSAAAGTNKHGSVRRSRRSVSVAAGRASNLRRGQASDGWSKAGSSVGCATDLDALQRIAIALDRPLIVSFGGRDPSEPTTDAGHLAIQELVLRVGRAAGYAGSFELPTRPAEPWRSVDVGLENVARRRLILNECWNTIGDVGAAARSSSRKLAELQDLATARWGTLAEVGLVWVVRATARNRALVARYPEVFASRFPGSSRRWLDALTTGAAPPGQPGLVWCDVGATRLYEWRRG